MKVRIIKATSNSDGVIPDYKELIGKEVTVEESANTLYPKYDRALSFPIVSKDRWDRTMVRVDDTIDVLTGEKPQ